MAYISNRNIRMHIQHSHSGKEILVNQLATSILHFYNRGLSTGLKRKLLQLLIIMHKWYLQLTWLSRWRDAGFPEIAVGSENSYHHGKLTFCNPHQQFFFLGGEKKYGPIHLSNACLYGTSSWCLQLDQCVLVEYVHEMIKKG